MGNNRSKVPDLEKLVKGGRKKFVCYEEGAMLYSMGVHTFQQLAKPKWEDTITNRMLHWSYTPEQKEEVKKALAAGVPKATILTYFYPEVPMEKMSSYRKKQ